MDLALNNLQWLICLKTKPNETKSGVQWGVESNGNKKMALHSTELK